MMRTRSLSISLDAIEEPLLNDTAKTSAHDELNFPISVQVPSPLHLSSPKSSTLILPWYFRTDDCTFCTNSQSQVQGFEANVNVLKVSPETDIKSQIGKDTMRLLFSVSTRRLTNGVKVVAAMLVSSLPWRCRSWSEIKSENSPPVRLTRLLNSRWRTLSSLRPLNVWLLISMILLEFRNREVRCFRPMNSSLLSAFLAKLFPSRYRLVASIGIKSGTFWWPRLSQAMMLDDHVWSWKHSHPSEQRIRQSQA